MAKSDSPKIYAGMLKKELLDVARRLGLEGVSRLRKEDLLETIQTTLRRPKRGATAKAKPKSRADATKPKASASNKTPSKKAAPRKTVERKAMEPKKLAQEKPSKPSKPSKSAAKPQKTSGTKRSTQASKARGKIDRSSKKTAKRNLKSGSKSVPEKSPKPKPSKMSDQSKVTAAKYGREQPFPAEDLRHIDAALPGLPEGYGEDRIVLLPRDPEWLYTYWDICNETKDQARRQGGVNLSVRLYELQESRLEPMTEQWVQEYSRAWYLNVPSPGQTYVAEIGYRNDEGGWLPLLRSNAVSVPPAGPSPVVADEFLTIAPDDPLKPSLSAAERWARAAEAPKAKSKRAKKSRTSKGAKGGPHEAAYRVSLGGTGADAPSSARSSAPSSIKAGPAWSASQRPAPLTNDSERGFWLMAEAELVVFGATEPKATLTVGGKKIRLREDGTFSIRMAFPDGTIVLPIVAVAEDGEQSRGLTMRFERATGTVNTLDNVR